MTSAKNEFITVINDLDLSYNKKNLIIFFYLDYQRKEDIFKYYVDIDEVVSHYYKNATYDIEPLTFILPSVLLKAVKKTLLESGLEYNDGYESVCFNKKSFLKSPVINRKTSGKKATDSLDISSFYVRVLSFETFLKEFSKKDIEAEFDEIYHM